jgi:hypothetical protein
MWGVGGLMGPPTVGAAMNFFDPEGFPITLGLSYAMLTALIVTNMIRTKRADEESGSQIPGSRFKA